MLALARATLEAELAGGPMPAPPAADWAEWKRGAFVTLSDRQGTLRGCIGRVTPDQGLAKIVGAMAIAAAREDPRFPPVEPDELALLAIEISVLSEPAPLDPVDPARIVIGRDGLVVRRGGAQGLLLPQVAPEFKWSPAEFLAATCRKAGLGAGAWREPGTRVLVFQADVFGETTLGGGAHAS